ncbi:MAG TPA: hypothetical protein VFU53_03215 [Burkholderiales bacterium]|nr:hypothetical protein [Burkholderiales bacterium]
MGIRRANKNNRFAGLLLAVPVWLAACSGSGSGLDPVTGIGGSACTGFCQTSNPQRLEVADVQHIIAQAVAEAQARSAPSVTIAIVDHVGNVLGVYQTPAAQLPAGTGELVRVTSGKPIDGGLDGIGIVPAKLAVISKALTATYFSAEQNAFSTRTANQIIQEHFNPLERDTPAGPLFSVQISQLPCSDVSRRFNGASADAGTHRQGIGFAADPGALPLYKQGTIVGSVAVIADGTYSLDADVADRDSNIDELIATAATFGFAAPRSIRADRITLDGKTLRFADVDFDDLAANPAAAPGFGTLTPADGALVAVTGYANAATIAGTYFGIDTTLATLPSGAPSPAFGTSPSGVRPASAASADPNEVALAALDGFIIVDNANANRFPAIAGTEGTANALSAAEVQALLANTLRIAGRTRSQVRQPLGSKAGIHVTIVDSNGVIVGMARTRDALVDAIDVTAQKARTAMFFSKSTPGATVADRLAAAPDAEYVQRQDPATNPAPASLRFEPLAQYVTAYQNFLGVAPDGSYAWSLRALGNISRPFFPDGIESGPAGPLSKPQGEWSIFSTGVQLDLVYNAIINHVAFVRGNVGFDVPQGNCTGYAGLTGGFADTASDTLEVRNGLTFFAGGLPIYKNGVLAGGIGASGDGLEQDNMVPLLALHETGLQIPAISSAAFGIRADQLAPLGVNLRWAVCPQAPFLDSNEQNPCEGK